MVMENIYSLMVIFMRENLRMVIFNLIQIDNKCFYLNGSTRFIIFF